VTFKSLLKSGGLKSAGLAALAIALAAPALTTTASAQDQPQRGTWTGGNGAVEAQQQRAARQEQRAARQEVREQRQEVRQQNRQAQQSAPPQQQAAPPPQQAQGGWQRGGGEQARTENRGDTGGQRWQGQNRPDRAEGIYNPQIDRNRDRSGDRVVGTDRPQRPAQASGGTWNGTRDQNWRDQNWQGQRDGRDQNRDWNRDGNRQGDWQGQRDGREQNRDWNRDGNRDRNYRDDNRNGSYRDNDRNRSYRDNDRRDNNWRDDRRDHRQWDRRWRDNNRYNWNSYRYSNRHIYTPGRYYSPYSNYSYRRLSIGFSLDRLFFGNRYWINDPWQYRLPEVYGDYRWVRYYDDVLMVDLYTGEVVDVIYDFFW
jgi:hypothetical protein